MQNILVIIDMQNDFITGSLGSPEAQAVVPKIVAKLHKFGGKVYATRDTHDADYLETSEGRHLPVPHCIVGTPGYAINSEILAAMEACSDNNSISYRIINKTTFGSTALAKTLSEISTYCNAMGERCRIELVGVCTDICVISNALLIKAYAPEIELVVDATCCAGTTPTAHQATLQVLKSCQIEVIE